MPLWVAVPTVEDSLFFFFLFDGTFFSFFPSGRAPFFFWTTCARILCWLSEIRRFRAALFFFWSGCLTTVGVPLPGKRDPPGAFFPSWDCMSSDLFSTNSQPPFGCRNQSPFFFFFSFFLFFFYAEVEAFSPWEQDDRSAGRTLALPYLSFHDGDTVFFPLGHGSSLRFLCPERRRSLFSIFFFFSQCYADFCTCGRTPSFLFGYS